LFIHQKNNHDNESKRLDITHGLLFAFYMLG